MTELTDIPINQIATYQQTALMRLQVWFTGQTHRLLRKYYDALAARLVNYADAEGHISPIATFGLQKAAADGWRQFMGAWQPLFESARLEAAQIPLGTLARQHHYFMSLVGVVEERRNILRLHRGFTEAPPTTIDFLFQNQPAEILRAAAERVYGDGFNLSQRLWRLDTDGLSGIQRIIRSGLAGQASAWSMARALEEYLGAGADCPRWTSTRLYKLTKAEIAAGDTAGLFTGNPCESKGVAYNSLRLARNEIQIVHHAATSEIFGRSPWVEGENVVLSASHPEADVCDDVAADNPHKKGTVTLPLHVQCLCHLAAELMRDGDFTSRMRGWADGSQEWPEMSDYAGWLSQGRRQVVNPELLLGLSVSMMRWLEGPADELASAMGVTERLEATYA